MTRSGGFVMINRIRKQLSTREHIERARITLGYCQAMTRIYVQCGYRSSDVFLRLAMIEAESLGVFYDAGLTPPDDTRSP